jgi:G3E family GTPase
LEAADVVILNKVDLVNQWQLEAVKRMVKRTVENPRILEATHGRVPLELLLGVGPYDLAQITGKASKDVHIHTESDTESNEVHEHDEKADTSDHDHTHQHEHVHHDHTLVFNTWTYNTLQPFSVASLREAVDTLPSSIYRIKGFTWLREAPHKRALLQVAGRRAWVRLEEIAPGEKQQTTLVLIGEPGVITQDQLTEHFDLCIAEDEVYTGQGADFDEEVSEAAWVRHE